MAAETSAVAAQPAKKITGCPVGSSSHRNCATAVISARPPVAAIAAGP